jgi:3-phenylpropionate/cinnamic acid dioxygenase small subunit
VNIDRSKIEDFLYYEAELLDERRLEEWLTLFDKDGIFWIPLDPESDPGRDPSILYDDTEQREARVYQLLHQPHWSQMPPSRTIHSVSNVRVEAGGTGKDVIVRCNLTVTELRSGGTRALQYGLGQQRTIAGRCLYRLLPRDNGWSIALKKVMLINFDQPLENLTFIL